MLRFIINRTQGKERIETFETIDGDVPALEAALKRGGQGFMGQGYDISEIIGVEVLPALSAAEGEHDANQA